MSKSPPGIRVTISPELRAWIDAQAEDHGCNAATWIGIALKQLMKQGFVLAGPLQSRLPPQPAPPPEWYAQPSDNDAWRGPVEEAPQPAASPELEAILERKLAEAEAAGATMVPVPTEMFARMPPQPESGTLRALSRPAPKYSPALQPAHLRAL